MAAKYDTIQRWWEQLYNENESKRLQYAVMQQLYKDNYGNEIKSGGDMLADYDSLCIMPCTEPPEGPFSCPPKSPISSNKK
jgi:hypothetical protein